VSSGLLRRENLKSYNFPSVQISSTLKMEATLSSETSGLTIPTRRNIPEEDILHWTHFHNMPDHEPKLPDISEAFLQ
jgi:hypothetical protein